MKNPEQATPSSLKISRALALTCRFGGKVVWVDGHPRMYSVAEHTVHMIRQARDDGQSAHIQMLIWLHDAPEYITGDGLPIIKHNAHINPHFNRVECDVMVSVCATLGLPQQHGSDALTSMAVKWLDNAILAAECRLVASSVDVGDVPFNSNSRLHTAFAKRITDETETDVPGDPAKWADRMYTEFFDHKGFD